MSKSDLAKRACDYHSMGRPGKIEVVSTKPAETQQDLTLAYSPGVAAPCLEIEKNPAAAGLYTSKNNLVAVISNGTAVLGLGDIGPLASKPVMEGKGILFKRFADIDVFDIELNSKSVEDIIKTVEMLEPTFGGINLEDIKAPECFDIEQTLKKTMKIPVFHDDQHGTAIVASGAVISALEIVGKKIGDVKVVINGAGASGLAIAHLLKLLGVKKTNIIACDTKGVIYEGRTEGMNKYKEPFKVATNARTLTDACKGADILLGLSAKDAFNAEMIKSLAPNPIIMAMANPDPEILPENIKKVRTDAIIATGRSDYPNQVNNVLCFPFLFRGALDTGSVEINDEMKLAAARALAELTKLDVPEYVCRAYGVETLSFGREYIIPKPVDARVLPFVAMAVAKAAMDTKVAKHPIKDWDEYKTRLESRLYPEKRLVNFIVKKAKSKKAKIIFAQGDNARVLATARYMVEFGIATPIVIGHEPCVKGIAEKKSINLKGIEIVDPYNSKVVDKYVEEYVKANERNGMTLAKADREVRGCHNRLAAMLLAKGVADAMLGVTKLTIEEAANIIEGIIPADEIITSTIVANRERDIIISDRLNLTYSEDLTDTVFGAVDTAELFGMTPKVAMINNSNFGDTYTDDYEDILFTIDDVREINPKLIIDGEMTVDVALNSRTAEKYPFSKIKGDANILVFPTVGSADAAYSSLMTFGKFVKVGEVIQGFDKPVQIISIDADMEDMIVSAAVAIASIKPAAKPATKSAKKPTAKKK